MNLHLFSWFHRRHHRHLAIYGAPRCLEIHWTSAVVHPSAREYKTQTIRTGWLCDKVRMAVHVVIVNWSWLQLHITRPYGDTTVVSIVVWYLWEQLKCPFTISSFFNKGCGRISWIKIKVCMRCWMIQARVRRWTTWTTWPARDVVYFKQAVNNVPYTRERRRFHQLTLEAKPFASLRAVARAS